MPVHPLLPRSKPSVSLVLLCLLLGVLWLAGGASRADALGQVVVRGAAALLLVVAILVGDRPSLAGARAVWLILGAAVALPLLQLVPLPPGLWQALPGRAMLAEAARASGQDQPWRPWSIVPGATVNAAASLLVPMAMLVLATGLRPSERSRLPTLLLGMVVASTMVGLLQVSGAGLDNPLINDTPGQVGGTFANPNHFALMLALGCLLAPAWAFRDGRPPQWRGPVALGLVLLFVLTILATGSRAGMILGIMGLGLGLVLVRQGVKRILGRYPRWAFPALVAGIVGVIAIAVLISVAADRAVSIDRAFAIDQGQDMRRRGLPTVLAMIRAYFPMGSGLGGFDPLFRMHEPFGLLKLTYFNHAHNDLLEVVLDAGVPGLVLLGVALAWWARASLGAWRGGTSPRHALPRLGSAMLLLVIVASAFDYPARTPMMMVMIVAAGLWLGERTEADRASALPKTDQHL